MSPLEFRHSMRRLGHHLQGELFDHVCVCMCMYLYVFACICMYLYACACICMYVHASDHWFCCQRGLVPLSVADYASHPLTAGKPLAPSPRIESFHMAVGMLWCFDASLNSEEKRFTSPGFPRKTNSSRELKRLSRILNCTGPFSLS